MAAGPSNACAHCGDRLIEKGYCPVCEDYLALRAGEFCPKHQIVLDPCAPPSLAGRVSDDSSSWVEVGHFSDSLACQPPRIRLEAEGIPTLIDGERMGDRSMYNVATGGVRLRVPEKLAGEARIILSQTWSSTAAALDIEDDWDEAEDEIAEHESSIPSSASDHANHLASFCLLGFGLALILAVLLLLGWSGTN